MGNSDAFHFSFSVVVLGDTHTGKSSLISCTVDSSGLSGNDAADPATDHGVKCKVHTYESRGARYQILMWEVPGAPRNANASARYATMAAGVLLVFDLTRRSTFERLPELMRDIEEANPGLPVVLVGNKADGEVAVRSQEASIFAEKNGVKYFETVAVRNEQVSEAFSSLIAEIIAKIPNPPEPSLLLRRRIQIGRQLAENQAFRSALFSLGDSAAS